MRMSLFGVLHGRQISLDEETGLPEGTRVAVQIKPEASDAEHQIQLIHTLFGSFKDDPSFGEAVEKIVQERHLGVPRDVSFDVSP